MAEGKWHCLSCSEDVVPERITGGNFEYGNGKTWNYALLRCPRCGMGRLDPMPTPEALEALYSSEYHAYAAPSGSELTGWRRRTKNMVAEIAAGRDRARSPAARELLRMAARLLEETGGRSVPMTTSVPMSLKKQARILDYGSGAGWWLRVMQRKGFTSLTAYDVPQPALETLGGLGIRTLVAPESLPMAAFDCIRLEQVLEHLVDPVAVLQRLREALAPDGSIVLTVPDYGCWSAVAAGTEWPNLALPHHLTHFTERALRNVAERADLAVGAVQRQPIWEAALAAAKRFRAHGGGDDLPPSPAYPLWRLRYHHWSRRRGYGEFIGVQLQAR